MKFLISWPPREIVQQNMPPLFKELFPNCRCIIDCSEIFIEIPTSFDARAKTFSNYKKHNTVKFLVGIIPCGAICDRTWEKGPLRAQYDFSVQAFLVYLT